MHKPRFRMLATMALILSLSSFVQPFSTIALRRQSAFVDATTLLNSRRHRGLANTICLPKKSTLELRPRRRSTCYNQQFQQLNYQHRIRLMNRRMHMRSIDCPNSNIPTSSEIIPQNIFNDQKQDPGHNFPEFFDDQHYDAFKQAIEHVISNKSVIRDFRKNGEDLKLVTAYLLERRRRLPRWGVDEFIISHEDTETNAKTSHTRQKLDERRLMYLEETGMTISQHRLTTVLLAHLADHCARTSQWKPLYFAWEKILEAAMTPMSRILSTYLYALGLCECESSGGRNIATEVAMYHDALYEPTEKTITLLVKSFVAKGDAVGAEALLLSISDDRLGDLRHRTTYPILKLYCEKGDLESALRLYHRMRTTSRVKIDASTYCEFISSVAKYGYFRSDSKPIHGAADIGYNPASGPGLLDTLVGEMAEDVLDISEESARLLFNEFSQGFVGGQISSIPHTDDSIPMTTLCDPKALVANRVIVDKETGKCPATNSTLRLIVLEEPQRLHVHETLLEMAKVKSIEYTSKLAAKGRLTVDDVKEAAEHATLLLKEFSDWLRTREGRPYTAIIDGPNVGYFGWGRLNLHQLVLMVNELESRGEYPLVIMPEKYTRRKFFLRQGTFQVLKDEEMEILERLKDMGQIYVVPSMSLDDMYWMLASVSNQTISTKNTDVSVPNDCFPGLRPIIISNDRMRDHRLDLLEERSFRRWCCSHVVNYNFTEYIANSRDKREISFHAAGPFSDEIQCNDCPGGEKAWHFPVTEWETNERFCLRLPL